MSHTLKTLGQEPKLKCIPKDLAGYEATSWCPVRVEMYEVQLKK